MPHNELSGWMLFTLCALLFLAAGIRDGDVLVTVASIVFLGACGFFLAPWFVARRDDRHPNE